MSFLQPIRNGDQLGVVLNYRGQSIYFYFNDEACAREFYSQFKKMLDSKHPELIWHKGLNDAVANAVKGFGSGIDLDQVDKG